MCFKPSARLVAGGALVATVVIAVGSQQLRATDSREPRQDAAPATRTANVVSPLSIFTTLGLTAEETAAVGAGRPVAKVLPWGEPSEVYVFGAVHIDGSSETYLRTVRDVQSLSGTSGYLGIGELSDEPTAAE